MLSPGASSLASCWPEEKLHLSRLGTAHKGGSPAVKRTGQAFYKNRACVNHSHTGAKPRESLKKNRRIFAFYRAAVNHSHGDGLLQNMDFLFAKGGEGDAPFVHAAVAIPQNLVKHFLEKLFLAFHNIQFSAISNRFVVW